MAALKLKKIGIRNWMTLKSADIDFPDHGLVCVRGLNRSSEGFFMSVGSGKTGFGEAIARPLLNVKGRFSDTVRYSASRKGDMFVRLECLHNDQPLIVESGYKCREFNDVTEGLRYIYGDQPPVERGRVAETAEEISKIIGVEPELAQWTVFIDGDRAQLKLLSQEKLVELVMAALCQPKWKAYWERSRKWVQKFSTKLVSSRAQLERGKKQMDEAEFDLKEAKITLVSALQEFDKEKAQRAELLATEQKKLADLTNQIGQLAEEKEKIAKKIHLEEDKHAQHARDLEVEINRINRDLVTLEDQKEGLVEARSLAFSKVKRLKRALEEMQNEPQNCPTCGKPWNKAHSQEEIAKQVTEIKRAEEEAAKSQFSLEKAGETITSRREESSSVNLKLRNIGTRQRVREMSTQIEVIDDKLSAIQRQQRQLERTIANLEQPISDHELCRARTSVDERTKVLKRLEASNATLIENIQDDEAMFDISQYWFKAFGPTGIPNMILREAIDPLNQVARAVSQQITGGKLVVRFSASKPLASGEERSKLVVNVDNPIGSDLAEGNSKGESGLVNFILIETLTQVGNINRRVGWRWYDETLPRQDEVITKAICAYLKDMARKDKVLIFLVEHASEALSYADYVLTVEKNSDGGRVYWKS